MNSYERVLSALQHKEPDRVPLDLGGGCVTGITGKAYRHLLDYLGYKDTGISVQDQVQQLVRVDEFILDRFGVDTRAVWPQPPSTWNFERKDDGQYWSFTDEWEIVWKMPKEDGFYYDMRKHPLAEVESAEQLTDFAWPNPLDPARLRGLGAKAKDLQHSTQACLMLNGPSAGFFELGGWLRGYENWYMDMLINPLLAEKLLDKTLEIRMKFLGKALDELKDSILVVVETEDLGSQTGPLISPQLYRKFVKPRQKELYSFIKKKAPGVYVFLHSCGSYYEIIPDLIDAGVDILNPVQFTTPKMDAAGLKKEFGKDLTFWGGGVDTQYTLSRGTPEQVRDEVKRQIEVLAPGGGFVFNTVHNIQADVPAENIIAMLETVKEYGAY
ncbi:uroporphyrinogen decarboxylase [Peptococcaceae bacterium CEB3]|nr:uroporphyrinogen decarboxylase [Peptococcaceae bacterium CEB3]